MSEGGGGGDDDDDDDEGGGGGGENSGGDRRSRTMGKPVSRANELSVRTDDGVTLAGEDSDPRRPRPPIVLLHGLTATRRYVVMGSRLLERSGHRVIAYDARGHGRSSPAPDPRAYGYERLAADLLSVLDALELDRAILAGASMGAHTAVRLALDHPERVAALGLITPAFDPATTTPASNPMTITPAFDPATITVASDPATITPASDPATQTSGPAARGGPIASGESEAFADWDALARGLREGGVDGFMAAYDFASVPARWRATVETVIRQRLSAHDHPDAVADALEVVPRSRPFEDIAELARIEAPALVVASRDEADPSHPLAVGERYAQTIPGARLLVEEETPAGQPARSPIAWQGGQLSRALLDLAVRVT